MGLLDVLASIPRAITEKAQADEFGRDWKERRRRAADVHNQSELENAINTQTLNKRALDEDARVRAALMGGNGITDPAEALAFIADQDRKRGVRKDEAGIGLTTAQTEYTNAKPEIEAERSASRAEIAALRRTPEQVLLDPNSTPEQKAAAVEAHRQIAMAGRDPNAVAAAADARGLARSDRSYQFNSSQLEATRKPLIDQAQRFDRLADAVAQGSAQADALIAPEMLTVMAGGAGSGLRINEAELKRVIGGRSTVEDIKATLLKMTTGQSITPVQRQEIIALMNEVRGKIQRRTSLINQANDALVNSDDVNEHRRIMANLKKSLSDVGTEGDSGGGIPTSSGKTFTIEPVP